MTSKQSSSLWNAKITVVLDYNKKANISLLMVNGQQVIEGNAGIYSEIKTKEETCSRLTNL